MWEEIGRAAIYGAIGGAAGAIVGSILALPFRNSRFGNLIATVLTVTAVIIGYNFAKPLLEPYIGDKVDALVGADARAREIDQALLTLKSDPMISALIRKEPGFEEEARAAVADVVNTGSREQATLKATDWARSVGLSRLPYYLARGRGEDILAFINFFADAIDAMQGISPPACYRWAFGGFGSDRSDFQAFNDALGAGGMERQSELIARLIENASTDIPSYDEAAAQAAVEAAGKGLYARLGPDRMSFINGARKATAPEDQAAVCGAMGALFRDLLARDNAVDSLRHLYRQAG